MKLVTFDAGDGPRAGVLEDERVVDAWAALGEPHRGSLRELIAAGRVEDLRSTFGNTGTPAHPRSAVTLLPPIPDPEKIICIGLNYRKHAAETGQDLPAVPILFPKWVNALRASGEAIELPAMSEKVDYEAEVAFVVGTRARNVAEEDALAHIAGYTLLNDLSARDLQFQTSQWTAGKVFDGAAPCGPALVTPEAAGPADEIEIAFHLNGEQLQGSSTGDLIFSIPHLLSHISHLLTLEPGDIVSTGTPEGVGSARQPRVWLKPGDEMVVSSPTLGRLENRIAD